MKGVRSWVFEDVRLGLDDLSGNTRAVFIVNENEPEQRLSQIDGAMWKVVRAQTSAGGHRRDVRLLREALPLRVPALRDLQRLIRHTKRWLS